MFDKVDSQHITQKAQPWNGMMPYWCTVCRTDCGNGTPRLDAGKLLCLCCAEAEAPLYDAHWRGEKRRALKMAVAISEGRILKGEVL